MEANSGLAGQKDCQKKATEKPKRAKGKQKKAKERQIRPREGQSESTDGQRRRPAAFGSWQ